MGSLIVRGRYFWNGSSPKAAENVAMLIEHGKVKAIGDMDSLCGMAPEADRLENDSWLIAPAFVDAHDHGRGITPSSMGVPDDALEVWLQDLNKLAPIPHRIACYYDGVRMAASGVGTVLHSHNPNSFSNMKEELVAAAEGYRAAGLRSILCPLFIDQNKRIYYDRNRFIADLPEPLRTSFAAGIRDRIMSMEEYLSLIEETRDALQELIQQGWTELQLHPNGGQWCSDESLLQMRDYALAHGMHVHLHLLETQYQAEYARRTWGKSFIAHYQDIGFLGPWVSFAHAVWLSEEDMALIQRSGAVLVNNASSNLRLRSGVFDLKRAEALDLTAGIGMDGCTLDDDQDYLREMRVAWLNNRHPGVNGTVDPRYVWQMAACKGARVAATPLSEGVLQVGHNGDFVCINMDAVAFPYADPNIDPLALTLQRGTRRCVDFTFINGEQTWGQGPCWQQKEEEAASRIRDVLLVLRSKDPGIRDNGQLLSRVRDFYTQEGFKGF